MHQINQMIRGVAKNVLNNSNNNNKTIKYSLKHITNQLPNLKICKRNCLKYNKSVKELEV